MLNKMNNLIPIFILLFTVVSFVYLSAKMWTMFFNWANEYSDDQGEGSRCSVTVAGRQG